MKILQCEPEEIENPNKPRSNNPSSYSLGKKAGFDEGKQAERQAWQAQIVDVDLDEMAQKWVYSLSYCKTRFTQYLKEQPECICEFSDVDAGDNRRLCLLNDTIRQKLIEVKHEDTTM